MVQDDEQTRSDERQTKICKKENRTRYRYVEMKWYGHALCLTIEVRRDTGGVVAHGSNRQRAAKVHQAGDGASMESLQAILESEPRG